jgi:hypothetical protein
MNSRVGAAGKSGPKSVFLPGKLKTEPTFKEALELMKTQFNNRV